MFTRVTSDYLQLGYSQNRESDTDKLYDDNNNN